MWLSALLRDLTRKAYLEYYDDLQQVLILVAKNQPYEEKLKKILEFYHNERLNLSKTVSFHVIWNKRL